MTRPFDPRRSRVWLHGFFDWYGPRTNPTWLEYVCDVFTHVAVVVPPAFERSNPCDLPSTRHAIELCHRRGVGVILTARLWCTWGTILGPRWLQEDTFFLPAYYDLVIGRLREQAASIGAMTGLDVQPYNSATPENAYKNRDLSKPDFARLKKLCTDRPGAVDLIIPGNTSPRRPYDPYWLLRLLGRYRVGRTTYTVRDPRAPDAVIPDWLVEIEGSARPFDLWGSWVAGGEQNNNPRPRLGPEEILTRSDLWEHNILHPYGPFGLFVYVDAAELTEVAQRMSKQFHNS